MLWLLSVRQTESPAMAETVSLSSPPSAASAVMVRESPEASELLPTGLSPRFNSSVS